MSNPIEALTDELGGVRGELAAIRVEQKRINEQIGVCVQGQETRCAVVSSVAAFLEKPLPEVPGCELA